MPQPNSPMTPCQSCWPRPGPHPFRVCTATSTANLSPCLALGEPLSPTLSLLFTESAPPDFILALHVSYARKSSRKLQALLIPDPLETILPTPLLLKVTLSGWQRFILLHKSTLCYSAATPYPVFVFLLSRKQPYPGGGRRCETLIR